jgi:membrane protease YdiL (CAAX protease family)
VVCLGLALPFGKVAFAPKWPDLAWLWAINNLLIVCSTEEAVFRGYLQEGLKQRFGERPDGEALAIAVAARCSG